MQTIARPQDGAVLVPAASGAVEAFFETVRREQAAYTNAVGRAAARLRNEPGQLAFVAATHSRLVQQFFDAQRLILARRAEIDAEVLRIARAADADAIATVSAAHAAIVGRERYEPNLAERSATVGHVPRDGSSPRQEIALLGVSVVRTMAEVDSLATIIDEAFEPDEPDCVVARRQLAAMLDDWWAAEQQDGAAAIDDAHARAAMRRHVAAVEANEIAGVPIETTRSDEPDPRPRISRTALLLPTDVLEALDSARPDDLSGLLESLARTVRPVGDASIGDDAIDAFSVEELTPDPKPAGVPAQSLGLRLREVTETPVQPGHDFWAAGVAAPRSRALSRWWIPLFVVGPIGLAASIFALTLKLVG